MSFTNVRTRFAPSPTGFLHIGGVRTALFNWLFARHNSGRFILRIDDTDQKRNIDDALAPILHGLRWLGIDWDEGPDVAGDFGPYYQSQKTERYQAAVQSLLDNGAAYCDYATPEELQGERDEAEAKKTSAVYSRRWMAETPADRERFEAEGRKAVVRLKMPRDGQCTFVDHVRGDMQFDWAREQDHVIQRADGTCLYHLASVVDDHDMAISHVIRAEEHLSNTPRQIFIAQSLGYTLPEYAHIPFVAEPGSKVKLSKRKIAKYLKNADFKKIYEQGEAIASEIGMKTTPESFNPVIVEFYEEVGYLADAVVNYLLLLGWSLDDKTEWFTRKEMIGAFSLDRVNKSPASFDPTKLSAFQEHHMNQTPIDDKVDLVIPYLHMAMLLPEAPTDEQRTQVRMVVEAAVDRIKVAGDILQFSDFFTPDDELVYDEKAFGKRITKPDDAIPLLKKYRERLAAAESFDAKAMDELMHRFVDDEGIGMGQIIHAVRVAATGKAVGFGVFESLAILGKERALRRIDRALAKAG